MSTEKASKAEKIPKAQIIKKGVRDLGWDIKKTAWSSAIESLAIIIFGILLVVWPDVTITILANILGAFFIVSGIYKIINYFVVKGQKDFFNNSLLSGVVSVLVGIAAIVIGDDIANVFRIIIGIWLIYEALVRMNTAIKLNAAGVKSWSYILIISLIMLVLGIFITFNTGAVIQIIGWVMIITGIVGIIGDAMFIQKVDAVVDKLTK